MLTGTNTDMYIYQFIQHVTSQHTKPIIHHSFNVQVFYFNWREIKDADDLRSPISKTMIGELL